MAQMAGDRCRGWPTSPMRAISQPSISPGAEADGHPTTPVRPGVGVGGRFLSCLRYVYKLAEALFPDPRRAQASARKMCRWLKTKPRGSTGSCTRRRHPERRMVIGQTKAYRDAYNYFESGSSSWISAYRRNHLPIGSGVTEAACKTVFTQRLKQSGMTWKVEGGQWIVDLRVIPLSGVWSEVYRGTCKRKRFPTRGLRSVPGRKPKKVA